MSSPAAARPYSFGWVKDLRMNWAVSIAVMHILSVVCLPFVDFSWKLVGLAIAMYYLKYFGMSGVYHRYFSHRAYETSRAFQFVLGTIGCLMLQKGPLWWAALHRHHHSYTDTEDDLHSPQYLGFWWSHMGWFLTKNPKVREATKVGVPDFAQFPELKMLDKYSHIPGIIFAVALWLFGGFSVFYWGFLLSQTLQFHGVFALNSWGHMWGSRRYVTKDTSRNSFWLAVVTFGDGWHHNHHAFARCAHAGFYWYEIDPTYNVLQCLAAMGLIWGLRVAPMRVLEAKRIDKLGNRDPYMENMYGKDYSDSIHGFTSPSPSSSSSSSLTNVGDAAPSTASLASSAVKSLVREGSASLADYPLPLTETF